jgi:hypothetical protein
LPQLPQKYPNMEMQAEIVTTSPPTASFAPQGIQVAGPGQIIVSVLPASGSPVNVFALNIQLSTSAKVRRDTHGTRRTRSSQVFLPLASKLGYCPERQDLC